MQPLKPAVLNHTHWLRNAEQHSTHASTCHTTPNTPRRMGQHVLPCYSLRHPIDGNTANCAAASSCRCCRSNTFRALRVPGATRHTPCSIAEQHHAANTGQQRSWLLAEALSLRMLCVWRHATGKEARWNCQGHQQRRSMTQLGCDRQQCIVVDS